MDYLLLTFMVTPDGVAGHPMDHVVTRIDLTTDGQPDDESMARLLERVRREVQRKAELDQRADEHTEVCR